MAKSNMPTISLPLVFILLLVGTHDNGSATAFHLNVYTNSNYYNPARLVHQNYNKQNQERRLILPSILSIAQQLPSKKRSFTKLDALLASASTTAAAKATNTIGPAVIQRVCCILHSDPVFVLSAVLFLSNFGISLERETTFGKALSAPLVTMAMALIAANFGIIPFSSPIYDMVNRSLVPLAVPLLLFDSDLRRVITDSGSLLLAFFIGAISTIIGTLVAFPLIPLQSLGSHDGWRVSCALAARHIGGAINFVAVAETLEVGGSAVSAAIAADNVVVALYFGFLFYLARAGDNDEGGGGEVLLEEGDEGRKETYVPLDPEDVSSSSSGESTTDVISMSSLATSITVSSLLVFLGRSLSKTILPAGTSALPLISILTVTGATIFPRFFYNLRTTGTSIGIIFMQMFFAASGAAGSIRLVLQSAPSLFLFSTLQIAVHFITLMGLGRGIFRLNPRELYLASNANVGGPTTAAAMATAKNWSKLVLPALLVGILGYATATPIALLLGQVLLRMPVRGG